MAEKQQKLWVALSFNKEWNTVCINDYFEFLLARSHQVC
jgi:hypothetical protein